MAIAVVVSFQKASFPSHSMLCTGVAGDYTHLCDPKHLSSSLLVEVGLNTTLLSLALVVLGLIFCLVSTVASDASNSTTDSARDAVGNTRAQVVELALGLLLLALLVLLSTLLLQRLVAEHVTKGLLSGAQGLVPRASATVGVVLSDT